MKYVYVIVCLVGLSLQQQWVLQWADEFNGPNIDLKKWTFEIGNNYGWGNQESQYYTNRNSNAQIVNGNLVITAQKESYSGYQYTSARMKTQGLFSTIYGKYEIRAKLPKGQGMWPAFWLLGDNISTVGWPSCGEIDVMEWIGKDSLKIYGSLHAPNFDPSGSTPFPNDDNFHTYAVNWQPGYMQFYVDGNNYQTLGTSSLGSTSPFEGKPFFLLLNLAVGGTWPGYPDSTTVFPQQFVIDYVRVYQMCWTCPKSP